MAKLGRNSRCPCGRLKKYKHCCRGKVDWDELLKAPISAVVPHLSVRGRNLLFLELLAGALQLDQLGPKASMKEMKAAFTPDAIRQIHEAVDVVWENNAPYEALFGYEPEVSSGLYVGMYEPRTVVRGVTRHSLYADRILLVDPFQLPLSANVE